MSEYKRIRYDLKVENIIAIKFIEGRFDGTPAVITIVYSDNDKISQYQTKVFDEKKTNKIFNLLPMLKSLRVDNKEYDGWKNLYIGFGNSIILRKDVYKKLKEKEVEFYEEYLMFDCIKDVINLIKEGGLNNA